MNVGASAPEEAGLYFSWGNTQGHTTSEGYEFTQASYNNTPGVEISGNIPLSQDAARVNMGGSWRMPTQTEFAELVNNCTFLWTTQNGRKGALCTSNVNGHSIFFPAAGRFRGAQIEGFGEFGLYSSSTISDVENACGLGFGEEEASIVNTITRYIGLPVRAVQD